MQGDGERTDKWVTVMMRQRGRKRRIAQHSETSQLSFLPLSLSLSLRCRAVSHQSEEVGWIHLTRPRETREKPLYAGERRARTGKNSREGRGDQQDEGTREKAKPFSHHPWQPLHVPTAVMESSSPLTPE